MMTTINIEIENNAVAANLKRLINQTYKLLPNREEGLDWQTPLSTIIEELSGMNKLVNNTYLFSLLCKLKGLEDLTDSQDFYQYRRIIFECLNLFKSLQDDLEGGKYE